MATITSKRSLLMGGLAFVLCVLAQVSLSSAGGAHFEFEVEVTEPQFPTLPPLPTPTFPKLSLPPLPSLPHLSLPSLSLPTLPPLPSQITIPGFTVPGFTIPPEEPLEGLHLPTVPQRSFSLPPLPGFSLPATTFLPPLPSVRFPGISLPPQPAHTVTIPPLNPSELTVPGFTFHTVSLPPTTFPFPRRAFPRSRTAQEFRSGMIDEVTHPLLGKRQTDACQLVGEHSYGQEDGLIFKAVVIDSLKLPLRNEIRDFEQARENKWLYEPQNKRWLVINEGLQ